MSFAECGLYPHYSCTGISIAEELVLVLKGHTVLHELVLEFYVSSFALVLLVTVLTDAPGSAEKALQAAR